MSTSDHRSPGLRRALALALAGGAALNSLPALAGRWAPLREPLGIADRTRARKGVALTFDDGPHPQGTPAVLEALARYNAKATFFLVGEQVDRNPALAREIVAAGHDIGLHCYRHRNLLRLPAAYIRDDIMRARARIEDTTGRAIELYRPPYGAFSLASLFIVASFEWRPLLWTHWGRDWEEEATPESIFASLTREPLDPGSVLLLHDADDYGAPESWRKTVAALPLVLDELARRELSIVLA